MKKLITLILALILIMSMSVSVMAAEDVTAGAATGESTQDVTVTYVTSGTVYRVDVTWESTAFTYTASSWTPESHSYAAGTWSNDGEADITVTNHSNTALTATVSYVAESNAVVAGSITNSTISLATAEGTEFSAAPNGTATFKLGDGVPTSTVEVKIGTITVTIS